jgi:hypothetical protein
MVNEALLSLMVSVEPDNAVASPANVIAPGEVIERASVALQPEARVKFELPV